MPLARAFLGFAALLSSLACSSADEIGPLAEDMPSSGGTGPAQSGSGGIAAGSGAAGGGAAGSTSGGSGNVAGSGGVASGGSGNQGGAGGAPTGGFGNVSGGDAGGQSGGTGGSGGVGVAGTGDTGGVAGSVAGGGAGMSTGGAGMAGAPPGGTSGVGGSSGAGGAGSGGAAGMGGGNGGSAGSGTPGLGAWTDGYVATMYGDINSGDCVPYAGNFTDHTPINTYTCVQGNGPRKVTLDSFMQGVENNASYYAAIGDLSSLWSANGNASPCSCNGSTTATCGGPQCPAEISSTGACGLCIAVKCDPNSTFRDSMNYSHNSSCNSTTFVVVQNIDACPHNHTTNVASATGWCTDRQAQHIDLSCSGLGDISNLGTNVGQAGWLPVSVQVVDCSIGLGKHSL